MRRLWSTIPPIPQPTRCSPLRDAALWWASAARSPSFRRTSRATVRTQPAPPWTWGRRTGIGDCTAGNVHAGTVDNAFWLNGTTSGHMIACGFVSGTPGTPLNPSNPMMYMFPFASNVITSTGDYTFVVNTTVGDECSPLTEFYNGTTDRMFFGVGSASNAYLESSTIGTSSLTTPSCAAAPTSSCVKAPSALGRHQRDRNR